MFKDKNILITGGTGSLGSTLLRRLLSGERGLPRRITVFSRDEAKQSALASHYSMLSDPISEEFKRRVRFQIGDIRDYSSVVRALRGKDIVFNAAALKQVPSCEDFPYEAVLTNVMGAQNIVRAISEADLSFEAVIGISTDKACKPVNVMGMTKAIQERIFLNTRKGSTRFVCVRYGNVLASRGSVIPLFKEQIKNGGPVTVTTKEMTRFLLSLDKAVDTVFEACESGQDGEIYIPKIYSASVMDIALSLIGCRDIEIKEVGIRPGEKIHEILVSEEEVSRTVSRGDYYVIKPVITSYPALSGEFSSQRATMDFDELTILLFDNGFLND
jgi:FlaA1/EpsC-like NDP-sugar epimerase